LLARPPDHLRFDPDEERGLREQLGFRLLHGSGGDARTARLRSRARRGPAQGEGGLQQPGDAELLPLRAFRGERPKRKKFCIPRLLKTTFTLGWTSTSTRA